MAESELYRKGTAMRRRLMGDAAVERLGRTTYSDPVMKKSSTWRPKRCSARCGPGPASI
jgi:hypothetical protein